MAEHLFSRRSFLETLVVSAGALGVSPSLLSGCAAELELDPTVFPQSVASGDPRADSIVLWTRAVPADGGTADVRLRLATDASLDEAILVQSFTAVAEHDHCLRLKVTDLEPGTTYHYRFELGGAASMTGRFRTAAAATVDAPVRFAVLSCQDFVGRYYNTLLRLLEPDMDDLDFVVHLGDYVYETTGDPDFMMAGEGRAVALREPEAAIELSRSGGSYYAARSVGNYRDLYRTFRSDPVLQRLHERFAFVCTWDDHEFSDDSHGHVATYSDGLRDEADTERRQAAEQVYFEYMPIAREGEDAGALSPDGVSIYPNSRLYRSFTFGQHLTLAMTDYRSFRPDHFVPEDACPGAVVLDEAQTRAALARQMADGEIDDADTAFAEGGFQPYLDLSTTPELQSALETLLVAAYAEAGVAPERASELGAQYAGGLMDAAWASALLEAGREQLPGELVGVAAIDPDDPALPRGLPFAMFGKSGLVGQLGSRYLAVRRTFELSQLHASRIEGDETFDDVLGQEQEAWLGRTLAESSATWNVVGNSVCNTSLILDLSPLRGMLPEGLPPEEFYLNVDHWDGFPERRRRLMEQIYRPANAVLLAGDIHAAYATDFGAVDGAGRVLELTTPGVSSASFSELLRSTGASVPSIRDSGLLEPVVAGLDVFLVQAFTALQLTQSDRNGVVVVDLDGSALRASWYMLEESLVTTSYYDTPEVLADRWQVVRFESRKDGDQNGPLVRLD